MSGHRYITWFTSGGKMDLWLWAPVEAYTHVTGSSIFTDGEATAIACRYNPWQSLGQNFVKYTGGYSWKLYWFVETFVKRKEK